MAEATASTTAQPSVAIDRSFEEQAGGTDGDSAYDSELQSYTTSLASGVQDYNERHGRRYHAYKEGSYPFPNDEREKDRLDVAHEMVKACLHGKLLTAPLKNPQRILDLGTGTGIWAIEIAEQFPDAYVLGNDLSPIQPRWVPPNVHFEVDDIEEEWTFSKKFDYIHSRCLYASIKDWAKLAQQAFDNLEPGGYAEFSDLDIKVESPDNSVPPDSALIMLNNNVIDSSENAGKTARPGKDLEQWVKAAGFEDVVVTKVPCAFGTWPKDKRLKEIGTWNHVQASEGLESFTVWLFTTILGWKKEEVDILCHKVRAEWKNPRCHSMMNFYNVVGRKPLGKGTAAADKKDDELSS